jgi:hypothetical protein
MTNDNKTGERKRGGGQPLHCVCRFVSFFNLWCSLLFTIARQGPMFDILWSLASQNQRCVRSLHFSVFFFVQMHACMVVSLFQSLLVLR